MSWTATPARPAIRKPSRPLHPRSISDINMISLSWEGKMSEQERPTSVVEPVGHQGARVEIQQRQAAKITGWLGVAALFGLAGATYAAIQTSAGGWVIALPIIAFVLIASSFVTVAPGQSRVVQFFGTYVGTVRRPGLWCVWPLAVRRAVSIRVRNFETNRLKVNDADGNPV